MRTSILKLLLVTELLGEILQQAIIDLQKVSYGIFIPSHDVFPYRENIRRKDTNEIRNWITADDKRKQITQTAANLACQT